MSDRRPALAAVPHVVDGVIEEARTEVSHAQRFARSYGLDWKFDHRRQLWLTYRDSIWQPDSNGQIYRVAIEYTRRRQTEALQDPDRKRRERIVQFAIRAESGAAIERLVSLAKKLEPIADAGDGWNRDPWLAGTRPHGVLDLHSGRLRAGDPSDRITRSLGVSYDPDARAPRWRQFLEEIFDGDLEVIGFVQRYLGYCLTGITTEQVLALFYGRGANGKGVLMHTVAHVLGDYFGNMSFSTLELKQRATIPNDVAALEGKRLVTASETSDAVRLNESRIKALTGCDALTARFLYGEPFVFTPIAKFVLATNSKPAIHDDSYGFWRRLKLVPFTRCFSGSARDEHLEEFLKQHEGPGILRWLVDGCLAWQRDGLGEPAAVRDATDEYRTDSDPLADFIAECCEPDVTAVTKASALFDAYTKWADKQRLTRAERLSSKEFGQRMAERFMRKHTNTGKVYEAVRLVTDRLW